MTQLQSVIGIATLTACLVVGMWASRRPPSSDLIAEIAPAQRNVDQVKPSVGPSPDTDDALIEELLRDEPASGDKIEPRKLAVDHEQPEDQHPVARLIARELPDASQEERQIWFEEWRHLPLSAVEDMLKVRRQASSLDDVRDPIAPQQIKPHAPLAIRTQAVLAEGTRNALQQRRAILLQNLLNADTIGYRCVEPQLSGFPMVQTRDESIRIEGLRWIGSRLNLKPGVLEVTERALDVAISGAGWFVVTDDEGKLAYTRNGSFQLSEQRFLELPTPAGPRRIHPSIQLPDNAETVFVDTNGVIYSRMSGKSRDEFATIGQIQLARFFDDAALTISADGLYQPLPTAGEMRRLTPGDQCGTLREGMLERANVNVESQRQALQRIENWLASTSESLPADQSASADDAFRP